MCGRYTQTNTLEDLQRRFGKVLEKLSAIFKPSYNIAPGQPAAVVTGGEEGGVTAMRWGLVPSWAKEPGVGYKMINARAETVTEKPAYKRLVTRKRCLVPADGFYEWRKPQGKGPKIPTYFTRKDGDLFTMAGLWDVWEGEEEPLETFTVITTEANDLVRKTHHRMPVILPPEAEQAWLDSEQIPKEALGDYLTSFDADLMKAVTVSSDVNSPANNSPACIVPVEAPPTLEQGDLFSL